MIFRRQARGGDCLGIWAVNGKWHWEIWEVINWQEGLFLHSWTEQRYTYTHSLTLSLTTGKEEKREGKGIHRYSERTIRGEGAVNEKSLGSIATRKELEVRRKEEDRGTYYDSQDTDYRTTDCLELIRCYSPFLLILFFWIIFLPVARHICRYCYCQCYCELKSTVNPTDHLLLWITEASPSSHQALSPYTALN